MHVLVGFVGLVFMTFLDLNLSLVYPIRMTHRKISLLTTRISLHPIILKL